MLLSALILLTSCDRSEPAPAIVAVEPSLACVAGEGHLLTITGQGLGPVLIDGLTDQPSLVMPSVVLRPVQSLSGGETSARTVTVSGDRVQVLGPDRLDVTLDPGLGLEPAVYDVEVQAADGRIAVAPASLAFAGAPVIDAVAPGDICHDAGSVELTLTGRDFIVVGDLLPVVLIEGQELPALAAEDCAELPGGARACSSVVVEIAPGSLAIGPQEVSARSASPMDCADAAPVELNVRPAPVIDGVVPAQVCESATTVRVEGSGFFEGMGATLGGVEVVTDLDEDGQLVLTVPEGLLSAGTWDLTISSEGGCDAFLEDALTVSLAPVVFDVSPPVVPQGLTVRAQARVTDVFEDISAVWLIAEDGSERAPTWSWDAAEPGLIEVVLPGDLAAGTWQVIADQGEDCPGTAGASVTVSDDFALALDRVEAPFAWTYDYTSVDLYTLDPLPTGSVGLQTGARAWLVDPEGVGPTRALHGLTVRDEVQAAAVVPYLLPVDVYDLIVTNPDGSTGWLPGALRVIDEAPPSVSSVSPGTLSKVEDQAVTILGQDFRDPRVDLTCRAAGVESTAPATVESWSYSRIEATIPTTSFDESVCTVEVTNADGSWARFASISITNPAQNLFPWQVGPTLNVARRAPAAAAGRTTETQRYLFAIGGDDGDESGAMSSIESAPVGVYGDLGEWQTLPRSLPGDRTLGSIALVEDFLYLVGGSDGAAAVATTWRARILDPLDVPWFEGLSLTTSETGLGAGTWVYRVSATYAADDEVNPGGESLAGDLISVTLPDLGAAWQPTLRWTEVEDATGYRIYRSPVAGDPAGEERWLADVTGTSFTDVGGSTDESLLPLPEGSLGEWAEVAVLSTERRSPCLAQAPDPQPDPEIVYLYAFGGSDAGGEVLDSIEILPITLESDRVQSVGSWSLSELTLSEARQRCGALGVDAAWHSIVDEDQSWIYVVGGAASRTTSDTVDVFGVDPGGAIFDAGQGRRISPTRAGFASASASNFLYLFGGQNDGPSSGGTSVELEAGSPPELLNWNSLGTSLATDRYLPGSAQESAVIFVVGGSDGSGTATSSVDWTNF